MIAGTNMSVIHPKGPAFPNFMKDKNTETQKIAELIAELAAEKKRYRKLTTEELAMLGFNTPSTNNSYPYYRSFVKKYYGPQAYSAMVGINSEYDDCRYSNSTAYIVVYDKNGDELVPLKETATQSRKEWDNHIREGYHDQTDEQMENIRFYVNDKIPALYVLEER